MQLQHLPQLVGKVPQLWSWRKFRFSQAGSKDLRGLNTTDFGRDKIKKHPRSGVVRCCRARRQWSQGPSRTEIMNFKRICVIHWLFFYLTQKFKGAGSIKFACRITKARMQTFVILNINCSQQQYEKFGRSTTVQRETNAAFPRQH